jgi:hypothetical protein
MSTIIKKNLAFDTLIELLYNDFPDLGWVTRGINYKQTKVLQNFEANAYISKFEFAKKSGIVCPNILTGILVGISFSTRNLNAENHKKLTDHVAKLCDLLATNRYRNLNGVGKLVVLNDPEILVGASNSSGSIVTDILYAPVMLRIIF